MVNIPLSQVSIIATVLGIFFLVVAFYKSIFHKRRHPSDTTQPAKPSSDLTKKDDQPIKLEDPFQQVPVDQLPLSQAQQKPAQSASPTTFYPTIQRPKESSVSAFRQFNPKKKFEAATASTATQSDAVYEWE